MNKASGHGPAWNNSLFEDNAEHGFGLYLGQKTIRENTLKLVDEMVADERASEELKAAYTHGGVGDMKCKKLLNNILNRILEPIRERRHELEQDIPAIYDILRKGSEQAREYAAQTMDEVRKAMQIDYFNDTELIRQQQERFNTK